MSDEFPDRLSVDPNSPYYNAEILSRDVGIRFKGIEKTNVEEYCISEGWVRVTAGNAKDRHGNPLATDVMAKAIAINPRLVKDPALTAAGLLELLDLREIGTGGESSAAVAAFVKGETFLARARSGSRWTRCLFSPSIRRSWRSGSMFTRRAQAFRYRSPRVT